MFQEEYIRDLGSNYLVLSEQEKDYDEFQVKMLMNNKIAGILECEIRVIDGCEKFLYEISSRQPISRIYERAKIDYNALISILRGIVRSVESAKEYLLDTRHFILQPDYMYMNPETKKISLCFFPLHEVSPEEAFYKLAEYILDKVDYEEERAVILAYDFYRRVKEDNFNIRSILKQPVSVGNEILQVPSHEQLQPPHEKNMKTEDLIEKPQNEKILFITGTTILGLLVLLLLWIQVYQPVFLIHSRNMQKLVLIIAGSMGGIVAFIGFVAANRIYRRKNQEKVQKAEESIIRRYHAEEAMQEAMSEETPYCGDTTLLIQTEQKEIPKLIHIKDGELQEIVIKATPFIIGKMGKGVDAVIRDHSISRMHARISESEGSYFLTDLNSTNGTYKNGVRLNANETTTIKRDDEIRLADLTFYFACC
ncbi:MAG: DUF6382 domain-containing protein [bacterium]|nr:DUF6382 domain-containing protein [bacterium]